MIARRPLLAALLAAPAVARAQAATFKIGAPLPLTGALAPEGLKQQRGYDLWADAINGAGGLRAGANRVRVELVYADYASNTPRAVQTTERMISQDHVGAVFAPYGSGATKAASSVTERYRVPMLCASASSKAVFDQNYRTIFGVLAPNDALTVPLAAYVKAHVPGLRRIALLSRNDLFPLAVAEEMERAARAAGIEVSGFERYAIGALDHASALTRLAGAHPEWIFVTGYTNDLVLVRRQMQEQGVGAPVVTMIAGPAYREYVENLGPLAEDITSVTWWHPALRYTGAGPFPTTQSYTDAFRARYGGTPDYIEAASTACGLVLQRAVEISGGTDAAALRDAMAGLDEPSFYGPLKFGPTGMSVAQELPIFQIQRGEPVVLAPEAVRQGEFRRMG